MSGMSREDAIKILNPQTSRDALWGLDREAGIKVVEEASLLAIADMEKQMPKKPLDVVTDDNEFICMICPSCEQIAVEFNDKHCRRCGQALDWSEEND